MNTGRYVLSQILDLVDWQTLSDNRNPPQAAQVARHTPQNFAAIERSSFRESLSK
jgi:hypothetical protein